MSEEAVVNDQVIERGIGIWVFFTVFLALLQVWILVVLKLSGFPKIRLERILADGAVIFFANAIAMNLLETKVNFIWHLGRASPDKVFSALTRFFPRLALGVVVLVMAVCLYCSLLMQGQPGSAFPKPSQTVPAISTLAQSDPGVPAPTLEGLEIALLFMALAGSFYEVLEQRTKPETKVPPGHG